MNKKQIEVAINTVNALAPKAFSDVFAAILYGASQSCSVVERLKRLKTSPSMAVLQTLSCKNSKISGATVYEANTQKVR